MSITPLLTKVKRHNPTRVRKSFTHIKAETTTENADMAIIGIRPTLITSLSEMHIHADITLATTVINIPKIR